MGRLVRSPSAEAEQHGASVVVVDPPRAGLDVETRQLMAGFDHILYISCNPDALARDISMLPNHRVCTLGIFDMFPYTTHAECAVRLRRVSLERVGAERLLRPLAAA